MPSLLLRLAAAVSTFALGVSLSLVWHAARVHTEIPHVSAPAPGCRPNPSAALRYDSPTACSLRFCAVHDEAVRVERVWVVYVGGLQLDAERVEAGDAPTRRPTP